MSPESKMPADKKSKIGWWQRWIRAAKKKSKKHWDDTKAAYAEYERMGRTRDNSADYSDADTNRGYPIYTTSCKTLEAAYYSRTPKTRSRRLYGIENEMALTMSLIADRASDYLIKHGNFDETMRAAVQDYIHGAKATTQVIYTTETEPQRMPLSLMNGPEGETIYYKEGASEPYDGEVMQDDEGYFYNEEKPRSETQQIFCAPCLYDEILHTPSAKTQAEITEFAYRFCMDRDEAEEKFNRNPDGTSKGLSLPYTTGKDYADDEDNDEDEEQIGQQLEGWECYCFESKKVYWVCEGYKDDFLAQGEDPYGLVGFIPSPNFVLANKLRKSMFTTPVFVYLEATINQLHELYARNFDLISCIERKAIVYGASTELLNALNKVGGNKYLSGGQVDDILSKGGLKSLIEYVDVQELVKSLSETTQLEDHFKQLFYEWFRLPDILRGVSDPAETLGAQELKTDAATDSFKYDKKQIFDLARDTAEIMLDMALRVWSDEKFAEVCGYEFLESGKPGQPGQPAQPPTPENPQGTPETPPVPPTPGHKERFLEALTRLRNDRIRLVSLDFETDSTSFRDDEKELAKQQLISNTLLQGMSTISSIQHPGNMQIAMKTLLAVLNTMGGSSQSEDMIKQAVEDLKKEQEAPPAPPPPDYEGMKLQIQQQKGAIEAQKVQMQAQVDARELGLKELDLGLKQAQQTFDQRLTLAVESGKARAQQFEEQLAAQKQASDEQLKTFQAMLDQALVAVEQQRLQIEAFKAKQQAAESMMEEVRLAKEATTNAAATVAEFLKEQPPAPQPTAAPPPHITIINEAKPAGGWNMLRDANGEMMRLEPDKIKQ